MTSEGWVLIIAATGLALTQVITAWRTSKAVQDTSKAVEVTKDLTVIADKKLDAVVALGDGMRTELLDRVAALEFMLASVSGNRIRADNAQQAAADHRAAKEAGKEVD